MYSHSDPSFVLFQGALASPDVQRRGGMEHAVYYTRLPAAESIARHRVKVMVL